MLTIRQRLAHPGLGRWICRPRGEGFEIHSFDEGHPWTLRVIASRVRYLQHPSNLFTRSHCEAGFLLWCNQVTTDGGQVWLATLLMIPSIGAPAQKKRAFSQMK
jgi:hypothetical protein